jgi:hypothetical protein
MYLQLRELQSETSETIWAEARIFIFLFFLLRIGPNLRRIQELKRSHEKLQEKEE